MDEEQREKIRHLIEEDELRVESVDPQTARVEARRVTDVMKHDCSDKRVLRIGVETGDDVICTEDHSLFTLSTRRDQAISPLEAGELEFGESIVYLEDGTAYPAAVTQIDDVSDDYDEMYDLSVEENENFLLESGILAHNSYSIGGISLDIDKSSKYQTLASDAKDQFRNYLEAKRDTVNIIRGLRQSRYGVGVRSAFGPITGHNVLTPRKYLGI